VPGAPLSAAVDRWLSAIQSAIALAIGLTSSHSTKRPTITETKTTRGAHTARGLSSHKVDVSVTFERSYWPTLNCPAAWRARRVAPPKMAPTLTDSKVVVVRGEGVACPSTRSRPDRRAPTCPFLRRLALRTTLATVGSRKSTWSRPSGDSASVLGVDGV
jgi:hypothetical protein